MAHITQGEINSPVNSYVIDIYTASGGTPTDVFEMEYQIYNISTQDKKTEYYFGNKDIVQSCPLPAGVKQSIVVSALYTDNPPGQKISTGRYFANWTCPLTEDVGDHVIVWTFKKSSGGSNHSFQEVFSVMPNGYYGGGPTGYKLAYDDVRRYMRDYVFRNILLDTVEYSNEDIQQGLDMCVDRFNITTPMTQYTGENFPSKYLLLLGTSAHLLTMVSHEQLRNQLAYNDGNIHVNITDKHQLYLAAGQAGWSQFDQFTRAMKNQMNNEAAFGDLGSPYSYSWRY